MEKVKMVVGSTSLRTLLISNAVFLVLLNIPRTYIPLSLIPAGELLRTIVVMSVLFLPILASVLLGYALAYHAEFYEAKIMAVLLLINGVGYGYTAMPLLSIFGMSALLSLLLFYVFWYYYRFFLEGHVASLEKWKKQ